MQNIKVFNKSVFSLCTVPEWKSPNCARAVKWFWVFFFVKLCYRYEMDPNSRVIKTGVTYNSKLIHPFYEPSVNQKTSIDIINEARVAIKGSFF